MTAAIFYKIQKHFFQGFFFLLLNVGCLSAQFITPVEGVYLKDFFIVNYPDADDSNGIIESYCGSKTYNGHMGTDFVLRNFRQMDSGVYAIAAANGVVFAVVENKYDRNKQSDSSLGFGNYVGIRHIINGVNYYTYYAHLRKNSVSVDSGQTVTAGQRIGLIGSSGNATDPHLHFEVWNDTTWTDPSGGNCKAIHNRKLWTLALNYDTALRTINQGFVNNYPILDDLRESPLNIFKFSKTSDSFISYWWQGTGIRKNDSIDMVWRSSLDSVWHIFSYVSPADYWYYYAFTYIFNPYLIRSNPPLGNWKAQFFVNNKMVNESVFNLTGSSTVTENVFTGQYTLTNKSIILNKSIKLSCTDIKGREIALNAKETNGELEYTPGQTGFLIYRLSDKDKMYFIKVMVNE